MYIKMNYCFFRETRDKVRVQICKISKSGLVVNRGNYPKHDDDVYYKRRYHRTKTTSQGALIRLCISN